MKKLNKLVLNKAKIMSAPQMKNITGGYGYGGGGGYGGPGTCCFRYNGMSASSCGWDRKTVEHMASAMGTNWCCDNCGSASWNNDIGGGYGKEPYV